MHVFYVNCQMQLFECEKENQMEENLKWVKVENFQKLCFKKLKIEKSFEF